MGFLREPSHIAIIAVAALVLFGGRRLPDAARGMGQAMRIFKSEIKGMQNDDAAKRTVEPVEPLEGRVVRPAATVDEPVRETPRNL